MAARAGALGSSKKRAEMVNYVAPTLASLQLLCPDATAELVEDCLALTKYFSVKTSLVGGKRAGMGLFYKGPNVNKGTFLGVYDGVRVSASADPEYVLKMQGVSSFTYTCGKGAAGGHYLFANANGISKSNLVWQKCREYPGLAFIYARKDIVNASSVAAELTFTY